MTAATTTKIVLAPPRGKNTRGRKAQKDQTIVLTFLDPMGLHYRQLRQSQMQGKTFNEHVARGLVEFLRTRTDLAVASGTGEPVKMSISTLERLLLRAADGPLVVAEVKRT